MNPGSDVIERVAAGRDGAPLPAWRFDFADLPARHRLDAWHEACSGFYDATMESGATDTTSAYFTWHRLDDLVFSSGVSFPHAAKRQIGHVRQQKCYVRLLFSRQGGGRMIVDDRVATLDADTIHLVDYSRPFVQLRSGGMDLGGVYVPHEAVGFDPGQHPAYMRIDAKTPIGQVLSGAFFALHNQLDCIQAAEAPALAQGFNDLVRALVLRDGKAERGLQAVRSARRESMRAFIERNLRDPDLGIDSLARNFGASRPTIYRDFEADGGIAHYVMGRRLDRALVDLVDHAPTRGAVSEVAESWGFETLSHFSRRFRARFGIPPSEVVAFAANADARASALPAACRDEAVARAGHPSAWFAAA